MRHLNELAAIVLSCAVLTGGVPESAAAQNAPQTPERVPIGLMLSTTPEAVPNAGAEAVVVRRAEPGPMNVIVLTKRSVAHLSAGLLVAMAAHNLEAIPDHDQVLEVHASENGETVWSEGMMSKFASILKNLSAQDAEPVPGLGEGQFVTLWVRAEALTLTAP